MPVDFIVENGKCVGVVCEGGTHTIGYSRPQNLQYMQQLATPIMFTSRHREPKKTTKPSDLDIQSHDSKSDDQVRKGQTLKRLQQKLSASKK